MTVHSLLVVSSERMAEEAGVISGPQMKSSNTLTE